MSSIVIVGGGPAGIAAAGVAGECSAEVTLLDDNPALGGQIWRGGDPDAVPWLERLHSDGVEIITSARVVSGDAAHHTLLVDQNGKAAEVVYSKLILATGARELFLPFPGWTLPNVMGVGGLQALVKSGLPVEGKRIVVAGSGPLLLAVAAYLRKRGAVVPLIAEQAGSAALALFALSLAVHPGKLWQAARLQPFPSTRYLPGCWIEAAIGAGKVEGVRLRQGSKVWEEPCDYVANAYGFVPNRELADLLGAVGVNQIAGMGGVETALLEGQIAGYAAAGQPGKAAKFHAPLCKANSFTRLLDQTFRLRDELRNLAQPETIVCRCEDVTLARLRTADSWRSAKLHERCGMGPCQGRICGPAVQFILGWEPKSVRPPLFPTRLENLIQETPAK